MYSFIWCIVCVCAEVIVNSGNVCACWVACVCVYVCVHVYSYIWCNVCVCAEAILKAGNVCACCACVCVCMCIHIFDALCVCVLKRLSRPVIPACVCVCVRARERGFVCIVFIYLARVMVKRTQKKKSVFHSCIWYK